MQENINYQLKLDEILHTISETTEKTGRAPSLLLHACCAPCSSYVLEYLSRYFRITVYYYNPNISERAEYEKRVEELKRLLLEMPTGYPIALVEGEYRTEEFDRAVRGLEHLGERSRRCYACYRLRLYHTCMLAKEEGFDYFTTTLSISPYKNAQWLNEIGEQLAKQWNTPYLYADFKKKNGYQRSIALSQEYHLYRQDFCGCEYSRQEEEIRKKTCKRRDNMIES